MSYKNEIYLGTVCLEKNRWSSNEPSIKVSKYLDRIAETGFDGIELWENHALLADEDEVECLVNSPCKVKILNTYCLGDSGNEEKRKASLAMANRLGVYGIKFNFGRSFDDIIGCVGTMDQWLEGFADNTRLLCEFHDGFNISYEDIFAAQKYVDGMSSYVEGISHAFNKDPNILYKQFAHYGKRISHVHVQYIRNREIDIANRLQILRKLGFDGSFTIEFTYGVAERDEDSEYVLDNAIRDMQMLRKYLNEE